MTRRISRSFYTTASRNYENELQARGFFQNENEYLISGANLIGFICSYELGFAEVLILRGADVNFKDAQGMTALHHATARGMRSVIRALIKCERCDYLARDLQGRYAFDLAISGARDYAVARLLIKKQVQQANRTGVQAFEIIKRIEKQ